MSLRPIDATKGCSPNTSTALTYLNVTVNPRPAKPTVSGNTVSLCQFQQTSQLTATKTDASATLVWYGTNATGGTGSTNAPQPSTASAGTSKYYVAQKLNDCESDRAEITVEVKAASPAPTVSAVSYCQGAQASQLSAVAASGGTLIWYGNNASGGTGTAAGPTPSTNNTGVQTYYVAQTVGNSCESQRVELRVTINSLPAAPITAKTNYTLCQYSPGEALTASGQNLKWYDVATGGTSVPAITPGTTSAGTKQYYVSQTVNGCEGPRTTVSVDVLAAPAAPTVTQTTYEFCQGTNAVISGNITPGVAANWYIYGDEPGLTNIYANGSVAYATISTAQARTLTYSLFQTGNNGCKGNPSQLINITVKPTPAMPVVKSVAVCQNETAPVLQASGQSLLWYASSTGGTGSATIPVVSTSQSGQTNYYVSQTTNGCESQRAILTVTVNAIPTAPSVASTGPVYCQNVKANALTANGQNLKWYRESSGGTSLGNSVTPKTDTTGNFTYYVSQTINGCEGGRSSITVKVNPAPAVPGVTNAFSYCQKSPATSLTATGSSLKWYDASGKSSDVAPTPSTDSPGMVSYFVTQRAEGCESQRAEIKVTTKSLSAAPETKSLAVCENTSSNTLSAKGENLLWYTAETGGTGSKTPPTLNTSQSGQTIYYVTQTTNGCESQRVALPVTVSATPGVPRVDSIAPVYCQNVKAIALKADGQNLKWYSESSGGKSLGDSVTPNTKDAGNFTYYVSQSVNGCEGSRSSVTVKVNASPATPGVTGAFSYCQKSPATSLTATGSSLKWYDASGKSSDVAPTPSTDSPGMVSYFVTQRAEGCESQRAEIKITTKSIPASPNTQAISLCQNEPAKTLSANGQNLLWYTTEMGGTGSGTAPTLNTSQAGQTTYYVSQLVDGCEGPRAALAVTVKPLPPAPGVTQKDICQFAKPEPVSATGSGELIWYNPDGSKYDKTPIINTDKGATFTYQVSQTVDGCAGPRATLSVNVLTTPAPTVAKTTVELCQGATAQPLDATGTNLTWIDPSGISSTTAPVPPTATPTAKPEGDTYFVTQTGANGCVSTQVAIRVFVQTAPTLSISGTTAVNLGIDVPLKLTFTGVGPYQYKLSNGLSGTTTKDTTIMVLPTRTTTYQVVEVTNKCGTGKAGAGASVTVSVSVPGIQTLAFTTTTLCVGNNLSTGFSTTGDFNPGSVFKLQIAKVETDSTKIKFVDVPGSTVTNSQISGIIPATVAAGSYWVRVMATNPKIPINGNISPTLLTIRAIASATLTGNQNIFEGQPAKLSVALTGDAPWTFSYRDSTAAGLGTVQVIQTSTSPYLLEVRPTKTTSYFLTAVGNGCGSNPVARNVVVVNVAPLLGVDDNSLADAVEVYPVPTTTTLTVRIRGLSAATPAKLDVTDSKGQTIGQFETRQETSVLSLQHQPAGTYILRIRVGERSASKRVIKL